MFVCAVRGLRGREVHAARARRASTCSGRCLLGRLRARAAAAVAVARASRCRSRWRSLCTRLRTPRPLIPRHRSGYATCLLALTAGIAFTGGTTVITLVLQAGSGWSVFWASFPLLISSVAWTIGTGLVTHLDWSLRRIVAVGTVVVAAGTLADGDPRLRRARDRDRLHARGLRHGLREPGAVPGGALRRPRAARAATRAPSRPRASSAPASARRSRASCCSRPSRRRC